MVPSAVFSRYARALSDVVMENNEEPRVTNELETYGEIFRAVPDLPAAFDSPAIPREAKLRVLEELAALYVLSNTTVNFMRVLLRHNRMRYFQKILQSYVKSVNERKCVVVAQVTSAIPLLETDTARLRTNLAGTSGSDVTLNVRIDPELLGGLVVQIGSTVYDGSIQKQLAEMRRRLAET